MFGRGESVRDDVFVGDLADLLVESALRRATGSFHAAGECARAIVDVAAACCAAVAAIGGPTGVHPRLSRERAPKWWLDQRFDLEATHRAFRYVPTRLLEGLKAEASWIQAGSPEDAVRFVSDR